MMHEGILPCLPTVAARTKIPDVKCHSYSLLSRARLEGHHASPSSTFVRRQQTDRSGLCLPPPVCRSQVRDSSLEVISLLAGISDSLRSRVGAVPGCVRTLARLVISSSTGTRVDAQVGGRGGVSAASLNVQMTFFFSSCTRRDLNVLRHFALFGWTPPDWNV